MAGSSDIYQRDMDDVHSPVRQQEIRQLVERLKEFRPTKIGVEVPAKDQDTLDERYRAFRAGDAALGTSEVDQVAFRIASQLNHDRLFAIDWRERGAGKRGAGDVYTWAKEHQPDLWHEIYGRHEDAAGAESQKRTILDIFRDMNAPGPLGRQHSEYVNMARIGRPGEYVGMDWLIWWYQRNLIEFAHICWLATSPNDRILVLIGSSHVQILSNFLNESGLVNLEPASRYLT